MAAATESRSVRVVIAASSILALTIITAVLIVLPDGHTARDPGVLPTVNAAFNLGASLCLLAGWYLIRTRRLEAHRRAMLAAFGFSVAFFIGYVVHHARVGSVKFEGEGWIRSVYFAILVPHIVLAAVVLPLVLITLYRGLTDRREPHRRIARWTLPLWLFVSVSGIVVYAMLYHG